MKDNNANICADCGNKIPQNAPFGLCPNCAAGDIMGVAACNAEDLADPRIGDEIAGFKILRKLGEGGFGIVYLARQDQPVRRQVALKVLKRGIDSAQVIARFESEEQALALMDHPNVATVFDGGETEDGMPYFAMEYVEGVTLREFCDDHHLAIADRLRLFVDVCKGVHHAHQKGIVHRDIKPSNVLVMLEDDEPLAKVIDFGVAKALREEGNGHTFMTRPNQILGTLPYMSPEQVTGSASVDARSDIYSLGALLYELLTGTPPFGKAQLRGKSQTEQVDMICEVDPPLPSVRAAKRQARHLITPATQAATTRPISKTLRGDIDWVVMKALEKRAEHRYDTAQALADDLRRYLNNEPVVASPGGVCYRARKFARRYRKTVGAAAVVAVAIALTAAVSTILFARAQAAHLGESNANARLALEIESRMQAHAELNGLLTFAVADIYRQLDGSEDRQLLAEVAEEAATYFAKLESTDLPAEEAGVRSGAMRNIGDILLTSGDHAAAAKALHTALELLPAEAGSRRESADILLLLADAQLGTGATKKALESLNEAKALYSASSDLASVHRKISEVYEAQREWEEAIAAAGSEVAILKSSEVSVVEVVEVAEAIIRAARLKMSAEVKEGAQEARTEIDGVINRLEKEKKSNLQANPEVSFSLATAYHTQGDIHRSAGNSAAALDSYRKAQRELTSIAEPSPRWLRWQARVAQSMANLHEVEGHIVEARDAQMSVLRAWRALYKDDRSNSELAASLAKAHVDLGQYKLRADPNAYFKEHLDKAWEVCDDHPGLVDTKLEGWAMLAGELKRRQREKSEVKR